VLSVEHTPRARALLEFDPDWHSDAFVLVELTNALATAMRVRGLPLPQAAAALAKAEGVFESGLHMAGHADVLALAAQLRISAYDARFLVVARTALTGHGRCEAAKAAPALTQSLAEAFTGI
jgi:hypothetical protein